MVRSLGLKLLQFCVCLSFANARVSTGAGGVGVGVGELGASMALRRRLAAAVCADIRDFMFQDQASADACPENFNNVDAESSLRSEVRVRCRWLADTLQLETVPRSRWQLAVLAPHDERDAAISYVLILPGSKYSEIDVVSPLQNYTVYSTVIQDGRAAFWHRHETVPAWDEYKSYIPEHKDYNIQMQFVNYTRNEDDEKVTGVMTWNHTGDADACFTFTNLCEELVSFNVWPEEQQRAVVPALPPGRACRLELRGLHGTTARAYRTPARDRLLADHAHVQDVSKNATLQVPEIVYVDAVKKGRGWAVRVRWARPRLEPERYTVVLRADAEHTLNVTGNATEATVEGVTGEGIFNVSLYAYKGKFRAHTFKRAFFIDIERSNIDMTRHK